MWSRFTTARPRFLSRSEGRRNSSLLRSASFQMMYVIRNQLKLGF